MNQETNNSSSIAAPSGVRMMVKPCELCVRHDDCDVEGFIQRTKLDCCLWRPALFPVPAAPAAVDRALFDRLYEMTLRYNGYKISQEMLDLKAKADGRKVAE